MKKSVRQKTKKISKCVYWTPRILSILFLLFLAMFSLDVFESASSFSDIIVGLLMHNIPVFILLIILIIAWKHEIVGAITFFLAGIAYIVMLLMNSKLEWYMLSWSLFISGPAFLIGILWLRNWWNKK